MKSTTIMRSVLFCLLFTLVVLAGTSTAQSNSPVNPAAIGVPVKSTLELGSSYDVTVTVLKTARGNEAWDLLKKASAGNKQPKANFEYIIAYVKFELQSRAASENRSFELGSPLQFTVLSSDGSEYESIDITPPNPALKGMVGPHDSKEGWVAFLIEQKDSKPMMVFDPASGGAMLRGKTLFFRLY
jgi:hypothetical protein